MNYLVASLKNRWKDPFFRKVIVAFIVIKIFILAMGIVGVTLFPLDNVHQRQVVNNTVLNAWAQYDGAGYLDLAEHGYNPSFNGTGNYSVYPLYPLMIFLLSLLPLISPALAAFIISNIFSVIVVILFYALVKIELGDKRSYKAVVMMLLFPTAYFLTAMYAESIFLALVLGMFLAAKREQWLVVGVLGFLASLARIQGVLMFIPMLYMYLKSQRPIKPNIAFLMLIPIGLVAMFGYQFAVTGDPLMQFHYGFGIYDKALGLPWEPIINAVTLMFNGALDSFLYNGANLVMFIALAALLFVSYKRLKPEYTIYLALSILFILVSSNLRGIGRYALSMFPIFMIFSLWYEESKWKKYALIALYVIFVVFLAVFIFRHVNQGIYLTFNYTIF